MRKFSFAFFLYLCRGLNQRKMKILHTSDWHLGHVLYNYERTEEQQSMLEQITSIVQEHKPDIFLIAGDIYHTPQPSSSTQTLFANAIMRLHNLNPDMQIIITAGNHDSAIKHEIFRQPWQALNVHTIGSIDRNNYFQHIIEVENKGFVVAIPYSYERNIPENFYQTLLDEVAKRNTNNLPVILSAHTTVCGSDFSGHERANEKVVGGIETLKLETIGKGYDYLALGHIHKPQFIDNSEKKVRYCGTPLPISFDENYSHSITFVDIEKHNEIPKITTIEIENPRPLVTLPSEGFAKWEKVKELLANFPPSNPAYIRLNLEIEDILPPEVNLEIPILIKDKECKVCYINTKRKIAPTEELTTLSLSEFQQEEPIEIAKKYLDYKGMVFDEQTQQIFNQVLEIIEQESQNK
jgi:exonuclease SbcD